MRNAPHRQFPCKQKRQNVRHFNVNLCLNRISFEKEHIKTCALDGDIRGRFASVAPSCTLANGWLVDVTMPTAGAC